MQEHAYRFGRAKHLVGMVGLPPSLSGNIGVIVLNAGLVHRIGPFRLHVEMTRRLNACGYPTLRFDLSTLGDSGASSESQSREQLVCADAADAMALLSERAGCTRFVLIGLCSGAVNAHRVACTDARIVGAIFLDGYAYRTLGYRVRHYLPRILNPARVFRFLTRRLHSAQQVDAPVFGVDFPPVTQVRGDLQDMLRRGLKLCFVYSGGASKYFNHLRQFRECFGRVGTHPDVSVSFLKEADHTYILAVDRAHLLDLIEGWLHRNLPASTSA
ncbi:alpha/beta fold hydrolase [Rhodanobacter sp. C01]|uniref:alpha/beta fold hydrolase n=1 Tax=Rhodanobacter sp. C01 TaxID=1945856 RepID=UPI0009870A1D|nr:alpha/beta fold hydrolase [Rhodanobacter sp. C01]OOG50992.1 alpha/beta hydrolase [Rhodanobacter sp. C01]